MSDQGRQCLNDVAIMSVADRRWRNWICLGRSDLPVRKPSAGQHYLCVRDAGT